MQLETSDCIVKGLYLGSIRAAANAKDVQEKQITHVLSLLEKPLPEKFTKKFTYKHVYALDMYEFDLLSSLSECLEFLDLALEGSDGNCNVLVHCQAGMSRSATVVIAYLMQKRGLSRDKALAHVVACRPNVSPNEGFMDQLQLLEGMGGRMERQHPDFRAYQLNILAERFKAEGVLDESEIPSDVYVQPDASGKGGEAYKCRKCRLLLFHTGAIIQHTVGEGEMAFGWRGKIPANQREGHAYIHTQEQSAELCTNRSAIFINPMLWMKGKIQDTEGKLNCPKCQAKIGSFVWYGCKCPCGSWVAPCFHIDAGKVDKIPAKSVLSHVAIPRPLPSSGVIPTFAGQPLEAVEAVPSASPQVSKMVEPTAAQMSSRLNSAHPFAGPSPLPGARPMATVAPLATATADATKEIDSVSAWLNDSQTNVDS